MNLRKQAFPVAAASLLLLLLVVGAAIARWSAAEPAPTSQSSFFGSSPTPTADDIAARVQQLEKTLDQTLKIQGQLLELVNELTNRFEPEPGETRNAMAEHVPINVEPEHDRRQQASRNRNRFQRMRENQIRQLTDAGLTPERAEFIVDKQERIQYQQMQLTYEYHHLKDKRSAEAKALQAKIQTYSNPRRVFEQELNSKEFNQYLNAFGGRTELQIGDLLESAPAYEAGLRPGDKIIRYNNQRVFHMGDLRTQVYQAEPGSSVSVEIQREGSSAPETIYLPAGPLGIRG